MISQPTFLPWLGWFDLADNVDQIILLDSVQFDKRSWQQRNRIRTENGLQWITVPVSTSGKYKQKIYEVELADEKFFVRFLKTLQTNYAKAPYFDAVFSDLEKLNSEIKNEKKLINLNLVLINLIAEWLDVQLPAKRSINMNVSGSRGEYLANLCSEIGAQSYISTLGAEDYLLDDEEYFSERGIEIYIHEYEHPKYSQLFEPFIPFASALDLIMMAGKDSGSIMRNTNREIRRLKK